MGDPAQPTVWQELDAVLLSNFRTEEGRSLRVRSACIDTGGHHGERVYAFVRSRRARRVFPTKGAAGVRPIWPRTASRAGSNGSEQVFIVGVDTAKDALYGRLRIVKPGPGYVHFPAGGAFDETYFKQLTAESVVTRYREGRPFRIWVLPKGARNEALDTFVLALAAVKALPRALERSVHATVDVAAPGSTVGDPSSAQPVERKPKRLMPVRPMAVVSDPYL